MRLNVARLESRRRLYSLFCLLAGLPFLSLQLGAKEDQNVAASTEEGNLSAIPKQSLQGRVVCLAEEMHNVYQTHLPTNHEHLYGFKTNDGALYTLLRTKLSEAIFVDQRVRDRELLLSVRILPKSHLLDVVTIKSVIDGVVHDLHYYCFICSIRTVDPAICLCCQEPVEFMEVPLKEGDGRKSEGRGEK